MKNLIGALFLLLSMSLFGQKNFLDQPYIETSGSTDTLVVPDKIYMEINLREIDSKNKKSVEEQERILEATLKKLGINTQKDLQLQDAGSNFKKYFLNGQQVVKNKVYQLTVNSAVLAGRVLANLEAEDIANVNITKSEYTKSDEMLLELKGIAMRKAKRNAERLAASIGQKSGKALLITDSYNSYPIEYARPTSYMVKTQSLEDSAGNMPIQTEFKNIKLESRVEVKFAIE